MVNVPIDPDETCGILPRLPSSFTITVKLKRKLTYRGHVRKQSIRPWKFLCALYHLKHVQNNPHYNDITICEHWREIWAHFTNEEADNTQETSEENKNDKSNSTQNSDHEDGGAEKVLMMKTKMMIMMTMTQYTCTVESVISTES